MAGGSFGPDGRRIGWRSIAGKSVGARRQADRSAHTNAGDARARAVRCGALMSETDAGHVRAAHAAAARGEASGLERLLQASYGDVWRLCAVLVDEQSAEDLAQETFLRVTRALRRYRGDASPRTWILSIARNVCMDELRGRHRRRRRERHLALTAREAVHAADPAGEVLTGELLAQLEPNRRAAFVLTQLLRLSYGEAGVVCGCPPGTIRSRVSRAREELIELIGEDRAGRRRTAQR
jgi:RNA polymerase sigma-70 factor (ECF subfamily)